VLCTQVSTSKGASVKSSLAEPGLQRFETVPKSFFFQPPFRLCCPALVC